MPSRLLQPPIAGNSAEWYERLRKPPTKQSILEDTVSNNIRIGNNNRLHFTFVGGLNESIKPILEFLDKHNIYAIFFLNNLPSNNAKSAKLLQLIQSKGHIIGAHTYEPKGKLTQSETEFLNNLRNIETIVYDAIGKKPYLKRALNGNNFAQLSKEETQYLNVECDLDSKHWIVQGNEQQTIANVDKDIENGGIVLLFEKQWTNEFQSLLTKTLLKDSVEISPMSGFLTVPQKNWLCNKYECAKEMNDINSIFYKMCRYNLECEYNENGMESDCSLTDTDTEQMEQDIMAFRRRSVPLIFTNDLDTAGFHFIESKRSIDWFGTVQTTTGIMFLFSVLGILCFLLYCALYKRRRQKCH